jgi:putative endonuclease
MAKPNAPRAEPSPERIAAFRTGVSAEQRAADSLTANGYRILARRFKTPDGEIDLVAGRRELVAFVDVKARARIVDAAYAVTPRQRQRIIAAAETWLMRHPDHFNLVLRFDAMLIAPDTPPQHLPRACDASPR